jgi:hypothetical protein
VKKKWNKGGKNQECSHGNQPPSPVEKCLVPRDVRTIKIDSSTEDTKRYLQEESDRERQLSLSVILNWITGVGAAISFLALVAIAIGLFFTRQQTQAALDQARTTQAEFVSSQRAWVALDIKSVHREARTPVADVEFTLRNIGHSIAKIVILRPRFVLDGRETGHECDRAEQIQRDDEIANSGNVIFPGDEIKGTQRVTLMG